MGCFSKADVSSVCLGANSDANSNSGELAVTAAYEFFNSRKVFFFPFLFLDALSKWCLPYVATPFVYLELSNNQPKMTDSYKWPRQCGSLGSFNQITPAKVNPAKNQKEVLENGGSWKEGSAESFYSLRKRGSV